MTNRSTHREIVLGVMTAIMTVLLVSATNAQNLPVSTPKPQTGTSTPTPAAVKQPVAKPNLVTLAIRIGKVALDRMINSPNQPEHTITAVQGNPLNRSRPHAHWLLPYGDQWLPPSIKNIAVLWDGNPTEVSVKRANLGGDLITIPRSNRYVAVFKLPEKAEGVTVELSGANDGPGIHGWTLHQLASGALSMPSDGELVSNTGLSIRERVMRDVSILESGPNHFRLFAISELFELALDGDEAAKAAFAATISAQCASNAAGIGQTASPCWYTYPPASERE